MLTVPLAFFNADEASPPNEITHPACGVFVRRCYEYVGSLCTGKVTQWNLPMSVDALSKGELSHANYRTGKHFTDRGHTKDGY